MYEAISFAPPGLRSTYHALPTAHAVGYILTPLTGLKPSLYFRPNATGRRASSQRLTPEAWRKLITPM